jgi:hypothetical protein
LLALSKKIHIRHSAELLIHRTLYMFAVLVDVIVSVSLVLGPEKRQ